MFYYPNRPILMPPDKQTIQNLEDSGSYIAEQKFNGDNITYKTSEKEFWNRDNTKSRYRATPEVQKELNKFPKHSDINLELMHYHEKTLKNILIVHCIMVLEGHTLLGKTYEDSRKIIESFKYGEHVKLSIIYRKNFWNLFEQADGTITEGIVLKRLNGKIQFSTSPLANVPWMFKVRKPCKKYSF